MNSFTVNAENINTKPIHSLTFIAQKLDIRVEIALNQTEREQGLMFRTHLGINQGMLFVYPDQAVHEVWMKNTYIPLDAIFLSTDGHIVSILENLQPCLHEPCEIYSPQAAASFMLELNAGFSHDHHLQIGQTLRLPDLSKHPAN
ncbi:DUF192 domain-containing protein [Methylomonas sp. AM2-LC]|uniref:DUF192 domain-containing protein n=1 Tax=Methylomonas sp. AM2-LC TaxID=3153301 RepID=UPI003264423C